MGPTGAADLRREVQAVWPEVAPFFDDRGLARAGELGLPTDPRRSWPHRRRRPGARWRGSRRRWCARRWRPVAVAERPERPAAGRARGAAWSQLPGLPTPGRVARAGRAREAGGVRRPGLLGPTGAGLGRGRPPDPRRRAWPRPRTAPTAPAGSSPATAPATGSSRALHRVGLAAIPTSTHAGDGQALRGTRLVSAVRCAPPDNKPTPAERDTCAPWLDEELDAGAARRRGGGGAGCLRVGGGTDRAGPGGRRGAAPAPALRARRRGPAAASTDATLPLLGCYHPSPHNTVTGRLTEQMTDEVLGRARGLLREWTG